MGFRSLNYAGLVSLHVPVLTTAEWRIFQSFLFALKMKSYSTVTQWTFKVPWSTLPAVAVLYLCSNGKPYNKPIKVRAQRYWRVKTRRCCRREGKAKGDCQVCALGAHGNGNGWGVGTEGKGRWGLGFLSPKFPAPVCGAGTQSLPWRVWSGAVGWNAIIDG